MSIATGLMKANWVGIRELKGHLSTRVLKKPLVITERGKPVGVSMPYSDMLELLDIIDEFSDPEALTAVREGRKAVLSGTKGITVSHLFKKIRKIKKINEICG